MKAHLRQIRISPKKVNLVAGLVRKKDVQDGLDILKFTPKKAAKILYKLLSSAVANAENNFKQDKAKLEITEIIVNEGPTYKRAIPCSRGRSHPILKRTSHVTLTIGIKTEVEEEKATKKAEKKEEKPKVTEKKAAKKATKKVEKKEEEVSKND